MLSACEGPRRTTALMAAAESRSPAAVTAVLAAVSRVTDGGGINGDDGGDAESSNTNEVSQSVRAFVHALHTAVGASVRPCERRDA